MRLIGCLSFYAERASWLAGCVASYSEAGITHLVAIDGAYGIFPDAKARSSSVEAECIMEVCAAHDIHLTLVRPDRPWFGNEVEKRTMLFRYAEAIAEPLVDWYLVIDADEVVTRALSQWTDELQRTEFDAADVLLMETADRDTDVKGQVGRDFLIDPVSRSPIRKLFRATPGLHCAGNHYTYLTPDGRKLWANRGMVPGLDMTDFVHIEHRTMYRSQHRRQQSLDYYARRDRAGIEA